VETSAQSAEAPAEPTGETVGATCCTRRDCEKELGLNVQALFGVCDKKDDFSLIVNSLLNITKQHL